MRYFDKFKTIFSKDKTIEYNRMNDVNTKVSVFDANYTLIPKYSELSEEDRLRVDNYQNQINYADYQAENYYGKIFQLYSRDNIELLNRIINKIEEIKNRGNMHNASNPQINTILHSSLRDNTRIQENTKFQNIEGVVNGYIDLIALRAEAQSTLNGLLDLAEEAKLKDVALERFMKKESRHNYDFLGTLGKDERTEYFNNKQNLSLIKNQLSASIIETTKQIQEIALKMYDINIQDYISSYNHDISMTEKSTQIAFAKLSLMEKKVNQIKDEYKLLFGNEDLSALDNLIEKIKEGKNNYTYYENGNIKDFEDFISNLENSFLANIVPYKRKIDIEAYKHREDYYDVVGELSDLFMKLSNIDSKEELEKYINSYNNMERKVAILLTLCRKYLEKDTIAKLEENYRNVAQILFILNTPIEYRYPNVDGIENVGLFSKVFGLNASNKNLEKNSQNSEAIEKILKVVDRKIINLINSRSKFEEEIKADNQFLSIVNYVYRAYFALHSERANEFSVDSSNSAKTNSENNFDEVKFEFLKYITALLNNKGPQYIKFFSISDAEKLLEYNGQRKDIYNDFILNNNSEYTFSYIKKLYSFFGVNKLEKINSPKFEENKFNNLAFGENDIIIQSIKTSIWNILVDKNIQEKNIEDVLIIPNAVVGYNGNIELDSIAEGKLEENRLFPDIFYEDKKGLFVHKNFSLYALSKIFEMKEKTKYNQTNVMLPGLKYLFVERGEGNLNSNREIYEFVISNIRRMGIKVLETDEKHLEEAIFKMEKASERIRSEEILQTA